MTMLSRCAFFKSASASAVGAGFLDAGMVTVRDRRDRALPFKEAVRKGEIGEVSHRVDRPDDYEGYALSAGDLQISKHGIGGVQFAQVAVDTETGVVKVERVVAAHDCGRPINPRLAESQILGGVIQGISYALCGPKGRPASPMTTA